MDSLITYDIDPGYEVTWIDDGLRLPTTVDGTQVSVSSPPAYNGDGPNGYNITNSEMGHLFYDEFGNPGRYDTSGNLRPGTQNLDWGLVNTGDFQNIFHLNYWSGTEYSANTDFAWSFIFRFGEQRVLDKRSGVFLLHLRTGEVNAVVPEPATFALLGIGLVGMAGYGVRRRKKEEIRQ